MGEPYRCALCVVRGCPRRVCRAHEPADLRPPGEWLVVAKVERVAGVAGVAGESSIVIRFFVFLSAQRLRFVACLAVPTVGTVAAVRAAAIAPLLAIEDNPQPRTACMAVTAIPVHCPNLLGPMPSPGPMLCSNIL